ncbi:MAG: DivIVA domain-containing protein [Eubacteriales bacterium]
MLTPQEVSERGFAKVSFGGYNMIQVDEFLDTVTADYTALFSENTALKRKMKVMSEKIEEYRSTEETMRKALVAAQKIAENMVSEGKKKRDSILAAAASEADSIRNRAIDELSAQEDHAEAVKASTANYIEQVLSLHKKEREYLESLSALLGPSLRETQQAPRTPAENEPAPKRQESSKDPDVQQYLERAMAGAMAETGKSVGDEDFLDFRSLLKGAEDISDDDIEVTTRFLFNAGMDQQSGSHQSQEDREYDAELAQSTSRLDFDRLQKEFGQNNRNN